MHLVYLNKILLKRDQEEFKDLWAVLPHGARVEYHSDLEFTVHSNGVVIIDESDEYIFNSPMAFLKFTKKAKCICLTATCSDNIDGGIERSTL